MLTREQVLAYLKDMRPEMSEEDWKTKADVVTVLRWAIPGFQKWQERQNVTGGEREG